MTGNYSFLMLLLSFSLLINGDLLAQEYVKIKHAEPLYLDLMRDLGARKGEAEFNIGYGMKTLRKATVKMLL